MRLTVRRRAARQSAVDSSPFPRLRLGIAGALGHTGCAVMALAAARQDMELSAAFDRPESGGERVGDFSLTTAKDALGTCDVIVDFSTATASAALARTAAKHGSPALIIGSTGFTADEEAAIAGAARTIAIVKSGNFSLGINLLAALVEQAAARLPAADWDIEILEAHHRRKTDAPSGTALMLGEASARGRGRALAKVSIRGRDGQTGARPEDAIGFASLRGGGLVGEHSVILAAEDEILTLSHSARDRRLFARGALEAALWVRGKPPNLYDMRDVLGFGGSAATLAP
ncbi:MAG: 4-hydroxy-tetrahydrodipicolinate reductase [Caulobacteraceae bacterium]